MNKHQTQFEDRSYPDPEPLSEIDRELFGPVDPIVRTNKRLTAALVAMTSLALVTVIGLVGLVYYFQTRPVRVLSINQAGQVESFLMKLSGFTLHKPETEAALRTFLTLWAEGFYSRLRNPLNGEIATTAWPKSLVFLGSDLYSVYSGRESREHEIAAFMSSNEPEFKAFVTNVVFRNLDKKPYEADIYFDRVYYSQPQVITAKKSFLVTIQFSANPDEQEIERLRKRAGLDIDTVMRLNPLVIALTQISDERSFSASPSANR